MKLYHYTSIATLALILASKSIRFSRLDMVDDPEEFLLEGDDVNMAQYVFVSCWSSSSKELLPQWMMYANRCHGVRIALEDDMFPLYYDDKGHSYIEKIRPNKDNGYFTMPLLNGLLHPLNYVGDVNNKSSKIISKIDEGFKSVDFKQLGKYKSKEWAFQSEYRFIFNAFPCIEVSPNTIKSFNSILSERIPMTVNYIDISLCESAFNDMEIMLAPNATPAEELIVAALMEKYLGHSLYTKSRYTGLL